MPHTPALGKPDIATCTVARSPTTCTRDMLAFTVKCTLDGDTQEAALVLGGALETGEEVATPEVEGREVEGAASVVEE